MERRAREAKQAEKCRRRRQREEEAENWQPDQDDQDEDPDAENEFSDEGDTMVRIAAIYPLSELTFSEVHLTRSAFQAK